MFGAWQVWTDAPPEGVTHGFSAGWDATKDLLRGEVDKVSDGTSLIVIEVDTQPSSIRQDGFMRADRKVNSDGVIVSFKSKYGPLRYACNTFTGAGYRSMPGWQANVRAVALGLVDLRRLERYGVARRGEQYTGFGALPPGQPMGIGQGMTLEQAAGLLHRFAQPESYEIDVEAIIGDKKLISLAYRTAAKKYHPDTYGDDAVFKQLGVARDLLIGAI